MTVEIEDFGYIWVAGCKSSQWEGNFDSENLEQDGGLEVGAELCVVTPVTPDDVDVSPRRGSSRTTGALSFRRREAT